MKRCSESGRLPPPRRAAAFALVVVLIILSMLVVVAVGYLSSMTSERTTANAFSNKSRAEQAAQAAVSSAMAMMRENIQAFPDSATVWDATQSRNVDGNGAITSYNEGTSLYIRAHGRQATVQDFDSSTPTSIVTKSVLIADPTVDNTPPAQPDNRSTFVLPLVSGVDRGYAQPVSTKASILPKFASTQTDASNPNTFEQTFTDVNVRRFTNDRQGAIGSPPTWTDTVPKPARARWVEVTSDVKNTPGNLGDDPVTSRYAFWIEDESFRANINYEGVPATARQDNSGQFTSSGGTPRSFAATDTSLLGALCAIPPSAGATPLTTANSIGMAAANAFLQTRSQYPGSLFPEPSAFKHGFNDSSSYPNYSDISGDTKMTRARYYDQLRYLTTTTSSSLNLTRHGTQRININALVANGNNGTPTVAQLQHHVEQIVSALVFHAPDFGQRFYRKANAGTATSATLNSLDVSSSNASIYLYKVAANLHDFIDTDAQPTIILAPSPPSHPTAQVAYLQVPSPLAPFGVSDGFNPVWAQGKDTVPFLQEAVVRFRPTVDNTLKTYDLKVDYYLEFWNMSDKDIYAGQVPSGTTTPAIGLNGALLRMSDQQTWVNANSANTSYYGPSLRTADGTLLDPSLGAPVDGRSDYNIDLVKGVSNVAGPIVPVGGVLFKAGQCTVITTDPEYRSYVATGNGYSSATGPSNQATTYYCTVLVGENGRPGKREYTGSLIAPGATTTTDNGIRPLFRDATMSQDYGTEVTLYNGQGYLDCFAYAVAEGGNSQISANGLNSDYSYGGSLFGNNTTPSELGDPRTNNEQVVLKRYEAGSTGAPDQTRYFNGTHSLGYPNDTYVFPDSGNPWPDYYKLPTTPAYANATITNAPAVALDAALTSIAQFGDIFDPARVVGNTAGAVPERSRGGGRTYRIGQHDDRYSSDPSGNANYNAVDNIPASTSWASWRLADIFCIGNEMELPARVNINGVARDNGAALRSLLTGVTFQPQTTTDSSIHGDPNLADTSLTTDLVNQALTLSNPGYKNAGTTNTPNGLQRVVNAMLDRLSPVSGTGTTTLPRPFFERGEIGELFANNKSVFGAAGGVFTSFDMVKTVDMNKVFDHGREEFCRRIMEQICTRGDVFTVYAVGQAVTQSPPDPTSSDPSKKVPPKRSVATQRLRVTFRLRPKDQRGNGFHPGTDDSGAFFDYNPSTTTPLVSDPGNARYVKPDHYDVEVLYAGTF